MFKGFRIPTHKERIVQLDAKYDYLIDHGGYKPFGYPFGAFGVSLVIIYLMIPHLNRPVVRRMRYLIWFINLIFAIYVITYTRGRGAVAAYGVGIGTWWSVLWSTAILIAYDGQTGFSRIQRVEGTTTGSAVLNMNRTLEVDRKVGNETKHANLEKEGDEDDDDATSDTLIWEDYPVNSFLTRLDWVMDLMSNFRGMAWNWTISNLPDPPRHIQESLRRSATGDRKKLSKHRAAFEPRSRQKLLSNSFRAFVIGYLCLDFIRTLMIHDPYFRGQGTTHTPRYLPQSFRDSAIAMQALRLAMALFAVYWALATIFQLAPLFFVGLLGGDLIGIRGEPWMYPAQFGSYNAVLERGLAGWWGEWWHQSFRFAFEAPARAIARMLDLAPRSLPNTVLQLVVAFSLSGSLHACASHTSIGDTRPIRGPFLFFFLQPFGIMGQVLLSKALKAAGVSSQVPGVIRQAVNVIVVHVWLYHTASLLVDDLAQGGQFLYEPVPFSISRLLGFGEKGDSWYCWEGPWPQWYSGKHWWESGIVT